MVDDRSCRCCFSFCLSLLSSSSSQCAFVPTPALSLFVPARERRSIGGVRTGAGVRALDRCVWKTRHGWKRKRERERERESRRERHRQAEMQKKHPVFLFRLTGSAHDDGAPARRDDARRRRNSGSARGRPGWMEKGKEREREKVVRNDVDDERATQRRSLSLSFCIRCYAPRQAPCEAFSPRSKCMSASATFKKGVPLLVEAQFSGWNRVHSASDKGKEERIDRRLLERGKKNKKQNLTSRTRGAPRTSSPRRRRGRRRRRTRTACGSPSWLEGERESKTRSGRKGEKKEKEGKVKSLACNSRARRCHALDFLHTNSKTSSSLLSLSFSPSHHIHSYALALSARLATAALTSSTASSEVVVLAEASEELLLVFPSATDE